MTIESTTTALNLNQIGALQQKRTLAFVNHFIITTTQFLNKFLKTCETKLMHYERKLEKINACVVLLEDRLSSIPEVNTTDFKVEPLNNSNEKLEPSNVETQAVEGTTSVTEENETKSDESDKISPEYMRFLKMVQVGVPLEAVKLKVALEGLDPNLLEKCINK